MTKLIATINFKGGVGKTTTTWCLANLASEKHKTLVFDLDPQMSLTHSVAINDDNGTFQAGFQNWRKQALEGQQTIYDALTAYLENGGSFGGFEPDRRFLYRFKNNLDFVPSSEELYWMELGSFDRGAVKPFIRELMQKIVPADGKPYEYVFFDCPPSFSLLSYSVLAAADLILIPTNADTFAASGTAILLHSLGPRLAPLPVPKTAVFMNKAMLFAGGFTKEAKTYWHDVQSVCRNSDLPAVKAMEAFLPNNAAMRRAVTQNGLKPEVKIFFNNLFNEIKEFI